MQRAAPQTGTFQNWSRKAVTAGSGQRSSPQVRVRRGLPTFFLPAPGDLPVPALSDEAGGRCQQYCTLGVGGICGSVWPPLDGPGRLTLEEYQDSGNVHLEIEHEDGAVRSSWKNLFRAAFGILRENADLAAWASCCLQGESGENTLAEFVWDRLQNGGSDWTGYPGTVLQWMVDQDDIPTDDLLFRDWIDFRYYPPEDDTIWRYYADVTFAADTLWRIYVFPDNCFVSMLHELWVADYPEPSPAVAIFVAGTLLHEMAHQYGFWLEDTGRDPGAYYVANDYGYSDLAACDIPSRIKNTFIWALLQRYPDGQIFSHRYSGEGDCLWNLTVGGEAMAEAYNMAGYSDGLRSVMRCLSWSDARKDSVCPSERWERPSF
jgi:hypothetical protein